MHQDRKVLLGIDLGTSSVKVVLTDGSGRELARADAGYRLDAPAPGRTETDPGDWWRAVCQAVRTVTGASGGPVGAIGLSGQMHGLVLVDGGGVPVRPAITWADTRAASMRGEWAGLDRGVWDRLNNPFSPGMAGVVLSWLARNDLAVLRASSSALQPKDYLRLRLTGLVGAEHTDASATLLYDPEARAWMPDLAEHFGIDPGLLPDLSEPADVAGTLTAEAATSLGLTPGIPVAYGLADTASAMLGSGLREPGSVQLTLGTGGQIVTPVRSVSRAAGRGIHSYAAEGGRYEMAAILGGGLALDWVRRMLGYKWAEFYALAARPVRPGDPLFLPHLVGERTPYLRPDLRGAWTNLALHHERADLARSALEGVALGLRTAYEALRVNPVDDLWLADGGTAHEAWREIDRKSVV